METCTRGGSNRIDTDYYTCIYTKKSEKINSQISTPNLTSGTPSGTRTLDPLIKSQLLYQLS